MRVLSWNVQYGKSAGNNIDFIRTLNHISSLGEFDIICLQEITRHMADYCLPGQEDQLQLVQQHFKKYYPVWGASFSWASAGSNRLKRQEFGNLTMVKADPLDYRVHQLPQPAVPGKLQMPRVAIEVYIASKIGPLSIVNTHLAFHDNNESQIQLEHLTLLEQERIVHHQFPKDIGSGCYQQGFLASARILCGDFNFDPESSQYQFQIDSDWIDAWKHCCPDEPHLPTCGIFDRLQWPQGSHCRDYFWLSNELAPYKVDVNTDSASDLSDHQPIILEIDV